MSQEWLPTPQRQRDAMTSPTVSAFEDFMRHVVPWNKYRIPTPILVFGLVGSVLVLATGLLALVLPSADAIRTSGFFWFLAEPVATLVSWMHVMALPFVGLGMVALAIDAYAASGPRTAFWRHAVEVESYVGAAGGIFSALFLTAVVFILIVYVVLAILAIVACGFLLVGLASTSGR